MTGFVVAVRYLTIVPLPGRSPDGAEALGRAAPWFPVIGVGLGLVLVGVDFVTGVLFPALLSGLLTVTAWKLLTGGLHLDGLADCLDGLAGRDADHRLTIMRDSRIGAFGALGLILFLLLEIAAVVGLPPGVRWRTLVAAPAIARATPVLLARLFRPARAEGHAAAFSAGVRPAAAPIALVVVVAVAVGLLGLSGLVALVAAVGAAAVLARFLVVRLGGITGDVLGGAVEVAELAGLLAVSAWAHVRP